MKKYNYVVATALVVQLLSMNFAYALFESREQRRERREREEHPVREGFHEIGQGARDIVEGSAEAVTPEEERETREERRERLKKEDRERRAREERKEKPSRKRKRIERDDEYPYPSVRGGSSEIAHGEPVEGSKEVVKGAWEDVTSPFR